MAGPLTGLKLLDFTSMLPGPWATMTCADLGAEVLRITSHTRPDPVSFLPPFLPGTEISAGMAYLGRGKRTLNLNLKDPRAALVIKKLIAKYDIVIEQFRPGVMARLGLDYESLRLAKSDIIYLSLTGYGQNGPLTLRAGHDINYLARSGIMGYSGRVATGPTLMGIQIADLAAGGMYAVIGILAAVIHRQKTGEGQYIDLAMADGLLSFHALAGCDYLVSGREPLPENTILNGGSLYDFYETADGKYLSFGGLEPHFFSAFCRVLKQDDLIEGGAAPPNLPEVKERIRSIIKTKPLAEWINLFQNTDACVEPVMTLGEALAEEQVQARQMLLELELPGGTTVRQIANPLKFSLFGAGKTVPSSGSSQTCPQRPDTRDNGQVLREAGFTREEIAEFENSGLLH